MTDLLLSSSYLHSCLSCSFIVQVCHKVCISPPFNHFVCVCKCACSVPCMWRTTCRNELSPATIWAPYELRSSSLASEPPQQPAALFRKFPAYIIHQSVWESRLTEAVFTSYFPTQCEQSLVILPTRLILDVAWPL